MFTWTGAHSGTPLWGAEPGGRRGCVQMRASETGGWGAPFPVQEEVAELPGLSPPAGGPHRPSRQALALFGQWNKVHY